MEKIGLKIITFYKNKHWRPKLYFFCQLCKYARYQKQASNFKNIKLLSTFVFSYLLWKKQNKPKKYKRIFCQLKKTPIQFKMIKISFEHLLLSTLNCPYYNQPNFPPPLFHFNDTFMENRKITFQGWTRSLESWEYILFIYLYFSL